MGHQRYTPEFKLDAGLQAFERHIEGLRVDCPARLQALHRSHQSPNGS